MLIPEDSAIELTLDETTLNQWLGRTQHREDCIDARQANLLKATLCPDRDDFAPGEILPRGWHWIYFLDAPRIDRLGRDGHAALGDFLPPVALPKRMWAGTRLNFCSPIIVGEKLSKQSVVSSISRKTGKSGPLCFVTVTHTYRAGRELRLEENHDIVYRDGTAGSNSTPGRPDVDSSPDASIDITPSSTLLFRYSALTFNGHRIHYDIDFCRNVEGYPGLVVHAPLIATLMLRLAEKHYKDTYSRFSEFYQRSVAPMFHERPFTIELREADDACNIRAIADTGQVASIGKLLRGR